MIADDLAHVMVIAAGIVLVVVAVALVLIYGNRR